MDFDFVTMSMAAELITRNLVQSQLYGKSLDVRFEA